MATTRKQIRRDVLRDLGDLRLLTATGAGDNVKFVDTLNLVGEPDAYAGREVLFTGGTALNLGEQRYVTGSSQTLRAIGFGVSLPAATAQGDEVEMINSRGVMYRFTDVHEAINQAIRAVSDEVLIPTPSEEETYARGADITIPAGFVTVEDVQWQDLHDETVWHAVKKAKRIGGEGWKVDRAAGTVVIGGDPAWTLDERTVRLWGLARPSTLTSDTDTTTLNHEWLVMQTEANLARAKYLRHPTPETERTMFALQQFAGSLRRKMSTRRGPFSEQV